MNDTPSGSPDPTQPVGGQTGAPLPWYRRPVALVPLGLLALVVIGLLVVLLGGDDQDVADEAPPDAATDDDGDPDDVDPDEGADEDPDAEGRGLDEADMDDTDGVFIPRGRAGPGTESSSFTVRLSWEHEVDDTVDPPQTGQGQEGATGSALVRLAADEGIICVDIVVDGVDDADPFTGAHLHQGGPAENGPVVVDFGIPDERGELSSCTNTFTEGFDPVETLQAIEQDPTGWYLNVHTAAYPDGVVRGQLPERAPDGEETPEDEQEVVPGR